MTLSTDAVKKALIQYLQTDLNMNVSNKDIDVSVIVGRKSADKPTPEVTATISISDMETPLITKLRGTQDYEERLAKEVVVENDETIANAIAEEVIDEILAEEDVVMPVETPESDLGQPEPEEEDTPTSTSMFG